ncbi:MAG: hypothetical protein ACREN7_10670, partial [Candidatus Dormibacteria bacterium]
MGLNGVDHDLSARAQLPGSGSRRRHRTISVTVPARSVGSVPKAHAAGGTIADTRLMRLRSREAVAVISLAIIVVYALGYQ